MRYRTLITFVVLFVCHSQFASADDWLRFRGPNGSGVAESAVTLPEKFSETEKMNWKTEMPGAGASGPIVVGDRVFVTCYSGYGVSRAQVGEMKDLQRHVVCVDRADGKILWQKNVEPFLPEDKFAGMGVPEHGYASSTPVSDGKRLFVFFGKSGVIAFDLDGNQLWKKSLGTASGSRRWGSAASPILVNDILIVNASDEDEAIYGLDPATGDEIWKTKNSSVANIWNTPIVVGSGKQTQLLISVPQEVWALNPKNGKLKWYATNGVDAPSVSTSLVLDGDTVIAMGGRNRSCSAIKTGGKSDVTETNTVWTGKAISSIVTPVVYQGHIYCVSRGVAYCVNAATGDEVYRERVPKPKTPARANDSDLTPMNQEGVINLAGGNSRRVRSGGMDYASPVLADGKIYQFTKSGTCYVIAAQPEFKLLATNQFETDGTFFNATPAISNGNLFVRSNKFLYSIGN